MEKLELNLSKARIKVSNYFLVHFKYRSLGEIQKKKGAGFKEMKLAGFENGTDCIECERHSAEQKANSIVLCH